MAHSHSVYDSDPHFVIDPITRAITNAESKKTILMQNDHNSERFSFEIPRLVEGHDITLCNQVEVHYTNSDSTKQDANYGVYEVTDMTVDPTDTNRVVFTWLVSENATQYAGSLSFIVQFACVENGVSVYRWNTAINNSIAIAKGMNNGESITMLFPDILAQWRDELFAASTGNKLVSVGPVEPDTYPYIWLDTSEYLGTSEKNVGYLTIKTGDGVSQRMYPVVKMNSIEGLIDKFDEIEKKHKEDLESIDIEMPESLKNPHGLTIKIGTKSWYYNGDSAISVTVPKQMTAEEVVKCVEQAGDLTLSSGDLTLSSGTLTANKVVGAVYM